MSQFDSIKALVKTPFQAVDALLLSCLQSKASIINELGHYIIQAGGKRLRPLVVLLLCRIFGYRGGKDIDAAAIIELIHTATLLHDDVVDKAELRRGRKTANQVFGNEAAVLVGDFLYSKAFQLMNKIGTPEIMAVLADTTNVMAEGEALQLLDRHNPETTEGSYLNVIQSKTGKLFEAAALLAAILAEGDASDLKSAKHYGMHLGTAFQLMDDLLDYQGTESRVGKGIGSDLSEGKVTLPLIYLLENGSHEEKLMIKDAIKTGSLDNLAEIQKMIETSGALQYTIDFAKTEAERAKKALASLPASTYKEGALHLAQFAIERNH